MYQRVIILFIIYNPIIFVFKSLLAYDQKKKKKKKYDQKIIKVEDMMTSKK